MFIIVMMGFGVGVGFFVVWVVWCDDFECCEWLYVVVVELYLLLCDDLCCVVLYMVVDIIILVDVDVLIDVWLMLVLGLYWFEFDVGCVVFMFVFGDVIELLKKFVVCVDVFFFDGVVVLSDGICVFVKMVGEYVMFVMYVMFDVVKYVFGEIGFMFCEVDGCFVGEYVLCWCVCWYELLYVLFVVVCCVIVIGVGFVGCVVVECLVVCGWDVMLIEWYE